MHFPNVFFFDVEKGKPLPRKFSKAVFGLKSRSPQHIFDTKASAAQPIHPQVLNRS